jgi:hypothetical protein
MATAASSVRQAASCKQYCSRRSQDGIDFTGRRKAEWQPSPLLPAAGTAMFARRGLRHEKKCAWHLQICPEWTHLRLSNFPFLDSIRRVVVVMTVSQKSSKIILL